MSTTRTLKLLAALALMLLGNHMGGWPMFATLAIGGVICFQESIQ